MEDGSGNGNASMESGHTLRDRIRNEDIRSLGGAYTEKKMKKTL